MSEEKIERLLSLKQLSELSGISTYILLKAINDGSLIAFKPNGNYNSSYRVQLSDYHKWVESKKNSHFTDLAKKKASESGVSQ